MTTEIAILNKSCVALAADSAVTSHLSDGRFKVRNTMNKVFALSKYHPVGILIYGSIDFLGIPFETIIKMFRRDLHDKHFDSIEGYSNAFCEYLIDINIIQDDLLYYILSITRRLCNDIINDIESEANQSGCKKDDAFEKVIIKLSNMTQEKNLPLWKQHKELVYQEAKNVLAKYNPTNEHIQLIIKYMTFAYHNGVFGKTGIFISGFGDKEIHPSSIGFDIFGLIDKQLIKSPEQKGIIAAGIHCSLHPLAMSDEILTFIYGIAGNYFNEIKNNLLLDTFMRYNNRIVNVIDKTANPELIESLRHFGMEAIDDFIINLRKYSETQYSIPLVSYIANMNKHDIASIAETFVVLAAFRKQITAEAEVVGGPIDVAVITKGDGFVWVKRKHYFDKHLNYSFFANYFKESHQNGFTQ